MIGQLAAQVVQQHLGDACTRVAGVASASAGCRSAHSSSAAHNSSSDAYSMLEQAALLQVGRGDAPAAAQVVVDAIGEHLAQGAVGLAALAWNLTVGSLAYSSIGRFKRLEDALRQHLVGDARLRRPPARPGTAPRATGHLHKIVEMAGLQRGILAVVGEAEQLARLRSQRRHPGAATRRVGEAQDGRGRAAALRGERRPACRSPTLRGPRRRRRSSGRRGRVTG